MEQYVHSVPGRLRVKIPGIKNQPQKGLLVQSLLESEVGIDSVAVNPVTGSVVVTYDTAEIMENEILTILSRNNYFDAKKRLSIDSHIQKAAGRAGEKFGKAVFGWAVGKALEANGLSFLAAFI